MTRILVLALVALFLIPLTGCGQKGALTLPEPAEVPSEPQPASK